MSLRGAERVTNNILRSGLQVAIKKAGLDGFRLHDCRRSWATSLAMAGVPLRAIQKLGGWRLPEIAKRYAAVIPASKERAARALDRIFSPTPATSPQQEASGH